MRWPWVFIQVSQIFDLRNRALLLIGYFGAFRRSELVSIRYENITFKEEGIEILIPKSKTDQGGEGQVCAIPYGNKEFCAINALNDWCEQAGITEGSIFVSINRFEEIRDRQLSPQSVNLIVKSMAKDCDLENADKYSGHSLRRGFATCASQKGASFASIMKQGRWKSEKTVLGYFDEGQSFQDNAVSALLNNKD